MGSNAVVILDSVVEPMWHKIRCFRLLSSTISVSTLLLYTLRSLATSTNATATAIARTHARGIHRPPILPGRTTLPTLPQHDPFSFPSRKRPEQKIHTSRQMADPHVFRYRGNDWREVSPRRMQGQRGGGSASIRGWTPRAKWKGRR